MGSFREALGGREDAVWGGGGSWSDMFRLWAACFDQRPSERGMLRVREAAGEGGCW